MRTGIHLEDCPPEYLRENVRTPKRVKVKNPPSR
jgi:hypothetical protein